MKYWNSDQKRGYELCLDDTENIIDIILEKDISKCCRDKLNEVKRGVVRSRKELVGVK